MKQILSLSLIFCLNFLSAQTTVDFENFSLANEQFLNGSVNSGGFQVDNAFLFNEYDASFDAWTGWAISNVTDNLTPGYANQYASMSGSGFNNSANYAVSYVSGASHIRLDGAAMGGVVQGVYVNNNAFAYYSMKDGDAFAKKFGGPSGNDPDFFLLSIRKYLNGQLYPQTVEVYLADFRFANNTQDYIISEWTYVDLQSLGNVDSLEFTLSSSDVGSFGMNTPAYFCIDDFTTKDEVTAVKDGHNMKDEVKLYPSYVESNVQVVNETKNDLELQLIDALGKLVLSEKIIPGTSRINLEYLDHAYYTAIIKKQGEKIASYKLLKQ
ncbi:MAG: DUF4465 domain-containing protein [Chitinophagales bacterium]